ncbi:MAG: hypothetical protein PUC85_13500, partial [bacterium]|nr:hypothetical protein [bacterium]
VIAIRQGAKVVVFNAENKVIYGFMITSDGKQLTLLQKDGQSFEGDAVVYFDLEAVDATE